MPEDHKNLKLMGWAFTKIYLLLLELLSSDHKANHTEIHGQYAMDCSGRGSHARDYYYNIRGLNKSLLAAKTLQKTKIRKTI